MLDTILIAAVEAGHEVHAAAAEGGPVAELARHFAVNWPAFIGQVVNFGLVATALWYFAYKPVVKTLDERQKKIADGLQFAEEAKRQLAETEKRQAETLREANSEAQRILADARARATTFEDEARAKLAQELIETRARAEEALRLEREQTLSEIRQEVARLVVLTSTKVLRRELTEEQKATFNQAAVTELARN